jgi:transcription antitermination factor NusG
MSFWTAALVHPNREAFARDRLLERSFNVILPLALDGHAEPRPLFSRYLFVEVVSQWREIERCFGVVRLVKHGAEPAHCPERVILEIRHRMNGEGVIALPRRPRFKIGAWVRIKAGPFLDQVGLYAGQGRRERERVLLMLLGREHCLEIEPANLVEA